MAMVLFYSEVRVHHWLLILIQLNLQVGVQQGSQGPQKTPQIAK